ncbi:uncharacterized protein LOC129286495 [Prosopis cineraria]|uniref:uncharacterized protein LOC129286495 n=1 Tax=Prosopis cineraria TaxID=364024 RepID=UPI00240F856F|nr:uncharacterized protein LOC129286495 [Prosopis cineraria]
MLKEDTEKKKKSLVLKASKEDSDFNSSDNDYSNEKMAMFVKKFDIFFRKKKFNKSFPKKEYKKEKKDKEITCFKYKKSDHIKVNCPLAQESKSYKYEKKKFKAYFSSIWGDSDKDSKAEEANIWLMAKNYEEKGTLLVALIYDADNKLFLLAFTIVGSETHDNWTWFLQNIKDIIGLLKVTIVSYGNNTIIGAVRAIFGGDRHAFCYQHVKENFSSEFNKVCRGMGRNNKEKALKLLDHIAYARHEYEFHIAMENLRIFSPQLARWVENQGDVDRWALSLFPF